MCGIAGFVDFGRSTHEQDLRDLIVRMTDTLVRRGPDDSAFWTDVQAGVALGHRRLSIIDLSAEGRQPMASACGRYQLVYNGEIYNYRDIRSELENGGSAPLWRGHSDTEVLLAAISSWGLRKTLERINGMFAIAVWDRQERQLYLARDRVGKKPLYYAVAGSTVIFASELKALRPHPAFRGEVDRDATALFLRFGYIPAPYTAYLNCKKLPPASYLRLDETSIVSTGAQSEFESYWSPRSAVDRGRSSRTQLITPRDLPGVLERLDEEVRRAVRVRMEADVPLGAFLSGGVDSSLVVALMQAQSSRAVRTFTIGFEDRHFDEAADARAVANHLRTEHTEVYVTPQDALTLIPDLPEAYDEPFSDVSQLPTLLVSRVARESVTVALSGDGGDEIFGGYNRYIWTDRIQRRARWLPDFVRRSVARAALGVSPGSWNRLATALGSFGPSELRRGSPGDKIHKLANVLACRSVDDMYQRLISHWDSSELPVIGARMMPMSVDNPSARPENIDVVEGMMLLDFINYLPGDVLTKVDRASMFYSLEARAPLLDYALFEFAWTLPMEVKIRDGKGKWLLRKLLERYVPAELMERPKMGFGVPIGAWLRGPLREWADSLLAEQNLAGDGLLDPQAIRRIWKEHLSGRRNWQFHLWDVLVLQSWLKSQGGSAVVRFPERQAGICDISKRN